MALDFDAIGAALAARFVSPALTAPATYDNVRSSTYKLPDQLPPTPCVLVYLPQNGELKTGNGTRVGTHSATVRFYYDQVVDLERSSAGLAAWLGVLLDQLRGAVQLGGTVTRATVDAYSVGILRYADQPYSGIELTVGIVTNEGWAASA